MKLNIVVIFGLVCLVALCSARPAEEDYAEYEDEPAPPPKKAPARTPLIGRRNPLQSSRTNGNSKATSTTAAPPPPEEEEEVVDEEVAEEQAEQTSSTTEAPKKLIKGGVRPFRSNDDLLATLKRRREQVAINKQSKGAQASEAEESAPAPVQNEPKASRPSASGGRRSRFNSKNSEPAAPAEEQSASTAAPARTGRRFNSRS